MTKKVTFGRFLRDAGTGFASLCFAGLLAMGTGCLPAASNDTGPSGGSGGSSSNSSEGGGSSGSSSSSSSSGGGGGSSSSSSSSSSGGGGSSSSSSSSKGGSSGGSSSSSGGASSSSSSSSSASGGGGSSSSATPTGGSTGTGNSGNTVTITNGKGVGAMTGYGWIAYGTATTAITEPTCGTEKFTSTTKSCAATTWATKDSLCISASIPALPKEPTSTDYSSNWGVMVGLDSTDAKGSLGQSFASVTIAVSGSPTSGLRAKVHLKGDAEGTDYCQTYASGALAFTSFTKTCYDTASPGTAITAADVTKIDQIGVQVTSGSAAIEVKSLCITGLTFK